MRRQTPGFEIKYRTNALLHLGKATAEERKQIASRLEQLVKLVSLRHFVEAYGSTLDVGAYQVTYWVDPMARVLWVEAVEPVSRK